MQIRELDLKELDTAYNLVSQLRVDLTYDKFEDLIYDMKYMDYQMIGIFDKGSLITYAGVAIQTTLADKRHLKVFDFITDKAYDVVKYDEIMKEYLKDYANVGMCESVLY